MRFINREAELGALNEKWNEARSQFFIIYGKRRVGKTELIKQFMRGKPGTYFLADRRSALEQLRELGRVMAAHFDDPFLQRRGFEGWLDVFEYLKKKARQRFILAVDEYPYLVEADEAVTSLFQKGWDEYVKERRIFLILSGSSVSTMESETLAYRSPLYGRRTGQSYLKPLSFYQSWQFFPRKKFDEFLRIFAVVGGLPAYLLQIDGNLSLEDNMRKRIFPKTEFLHNEVEFMLKEELREPRNYLSILKAISWGKRKFGEIANDTGLERNVLTKYLGVLERLQLIEREVPVTEMSLMKSRKGLYTISDNFVTFWFQYLFPYRSDLEMERFGDAMRKYTETSPVLESRVYEKVCQETLSNLEERLFLFERVGKWWEKDQEIDVVGLNHDTREIVFGEAKWSHKAVGVNILRELERKADLVQWNRGRRREYYILFSRSGFTPDMLSLSKERKIFLVHKDKLLP